MYWFQKDLRKEINGITLEEWVKQNVNDTARHVVVYMSIDKGYKEVMHSYGVKEISVGQLEQIKDYKIEKVIPVLVKDSVERYIVLIG